MAMAASAADVRSILSIPGPSSAPAIPQYKPKPATTSVRKPEGISRELYSLIGPSAPALAAQLAKPRLKQKPNLGSAEKVKWEYRPFSNRGRSDGLMLSHWAKSATDPDAEYPFVQYNVPSSLYTYSDEEYQQHLEDVSWSKEETDYLYTILRDYDVRWPIIYDRYEYPGQTRTMEDIKDRYYGICRKLIRSRPWIGDEASKNALHNSYLFDKDKESLRKRHILSLENRTPEQIMEEEALFIEIKRLEQTERKFRRERDDLLRTLAGIDSGLPDILEDENNLGGSLPNELKRKRKGNEETPSTPLLPTSASPVKRVQSAKDAAQDAKHFINRIEIPASTSASVTKAAHQPAYLRSHKVTYPKGNNLSRVTQILEELGVNINRLVMPTYGNLEKMESLIETAVSLIELKKAVDKVDFDIGVAKGRLGLRGSEGAADAMDVDHPEDGRAQSVVSTKSASGRGRIKDHQRSVSISSVDTSATASARPGNARRKR